MRRYIDASARDYNTMHSVKPLGRQQQRVKLARPMQNEIPNAFV